MCQTTPFTGIGRMPHQTNSNIKYGYQLTYTLLGVSHCAYGSLGP